MEVITGTGHWYKSGRPLVAVRWVFVRDLTGTHRDEYFFTTDSTMSPESVIETYTGRWNIETTFQEVRSYLRLETTRGWSRDTVLRVGPCLFGLYTVVAYLYAELPSRYARVRVVDWPGKRDVTFSDAITAVRRWLSQAGEAAGDLLAIQRDAKLQATVAVIKRRNDPLTLKDLAVRGDDLIEAGVRSGPEVGDTLQRLLDEVLEDPTRNTREYLLSRV